LQTDISSNSIIEQAAESIGTFPKTILELLETVGLADEIIYPDASQFQIYVEGKKLSPPQGLRFMVPTQIEQFNKSSFFSDLGKKRILEEANIPALKSKANTTLKDFVVRRFGDEMYERYAAPVYGGIFGYDADRLSLNSVLPQLPKWEMEYGSVTKAVQTLYPSAFSATASANKAANFFSLKNGLHSLPLAIAKKLKHTKIILNSKVENLQRETSSPINQWKINESLFDELFISSAAHATAQIIQNVHLELSRLLQQITFKSAGILTLIFNKVDIDLDEIVSGVLLPVDEFPSFSALTFSSNKWTNRIETDKILLRLYLRDTPLLHQPLETIQKEGSLVLEQLVTVKKTPQKLHYHLWPDSRPLCKTGHQEIIQQIERALKDLPGLHLTGCSYKGSGVASLVHQSKMLASLV